VVNRALSDSQADGVRATARPNASAGEPGVAMAHDLNGAALASRGGFAGERASLIGSAVSGAVGGATRQIPGLLASALNPGQP
jgi:hypothetical protein